MGSDKSNLSTLMGIRSLDRGTLSPLYLFIYGYKFIKICYLPDGRSELGNTVPDVLKTVDSEGKGNI